MDINHVVEWIRELAGDGYCVYHDPCTSSVYRIVGPIKPKYRDRAAIGVWADVPDAQDIVFLTVDMGDGVVCVNVSGMCVNPVGSDEIVFNYCLGDPELGSKLRWYFGYLK